MTAEGDNSVLMQKVAKEHLGVMAKKGFKNPMVYPDNEQFTNKDYLMWILNQREVTLFGTLGKKMAAAGKEGMFNTWMMEESDVIQGAARSFGDRLIAERLVKFAKINCTTFDPVLDARILSSLVAGSNF